MAKHRATAESISQACIQMIDGMRGMLTGLEETVHEVRIAGAPDDADELRDILDAHRVILAAIEELRVSASAFVPAYAAAGESLRMMLDEN